MLYVIGCGARLEFVKVTIHPLFFGAMIFFALFGGLPSALICLVTALMHESGHIFCAARMGFKCERIKIMPYGAAAMCDVEGIRAGDEIKLALAGPLVNAVTCVALAGLWWFFPETYAYTDTVMHANIAMLTVNLLPAYPLDGGRVAGCVFRKLFSKRAAVIVLKIISVLVAAALIVAFFFSGYNPTLLFFSVFLVCSAIEKAPSIELINFSSKGKLQRGIEVRYVLCDRSLTFKDAFKKLDDKRYLVLQLYDGGVADEITQDELYELASTHSFYDRVFEGEENEDFPFAEMGYLSRNERENRPPETLPESTALIQSEASETASSTAPESEVKS